MDEFWVFPTNDENLATIEVSDTTNFKHTSWSCTRFNEFEFAIIPAFFRWYIRENLLVNGGSRSLAQLAAVSSRTEDILRIERKMTPCTAISGQVPPRPGKSVGSPRLFGHFSILLCWIWEFSKIQRNFTKKFFKVQTWNFCEIPRNVHQNRLDDEFDTKLQNSQGWGTLQIVFDWVLLTFWG